MRNKFSFPNYKLTINLKMEENGNCYVEHTHPFRLLHIIPAFTLQEGFQKSLTFTVFAEGRPCNFTFEVLGVS